MSKEENKEEINIHINGGTPDNYWVITQSEKALGPYESYEDAYIAASVNLGLEGWTITVA